MGNKNSKFFSKVNKEKISLKLYNLFTKNSIFYTKTKPCFMKLIEEANLKQFAIQFTQ